LVVLVEPEGVSGAVPARLKKKDYIQKEDQMYSWGLQPNLAITKVG
jgi:hypothetical protein